MDGNRYLDFAGGIGCLNVGHRREEVVDAVKDQLDRFLHTCVQVMPYESYVRLAERMNEVTPGKFAKKTIFVNSGAEAVENAVKIARAYTKRPGIIAFEDAFHEAAWNGFTEEASLGWGCAVDWTVWDI